jgi:hypothetical protein
MALVPCNFQYYSHCQVVFNGLFSQRQYFRRKYYDYTIAEINAQIEILDPSYLHFHKTVFKLL